MRLKALRSMTYATRRLQAGDVFEAKNPRDHKILLARRPPRVEEMRAKRAAPPATPQSAAPNPPVTPPTPESVGAMTTTQTPNTPGGDDRTALRAEYETVLGKAPFPGWSADVLREKIAAAKEQNQS